MTILFISGLINDERRLGDLISGQAPWANDETSVYREVDGYTVINGEYEGDGESLGDLGQWFQS